MFNVCCKRQHQILEIEGLSKTLLALLFYKISFIAQLFKRYLAYLAQNGHHDIEQADSEPVGYQ